jgi:hypothetical protein
LKELEGASRENLARRWREHSRLCRLIEVVAEQRSRKGEKLDFRSFNPQHPIGKR